MRPSTRAQISTVALLNAVLVGFLGVCLWFLHLGITTEPWLLPHAIAMLVMTTGLLFAINWLIVTVGTVSAEEQRRELKGGKEETAGSES